MADFNVIDPQANQILVWSDIDSAFINVDADADALGIDFPTLTVTKLSVDGESLAHSFQGDTLRTRTLDVGAGLTMDVTNSKITLSVSGTDATTLNGFSDTDFLKVSNNLSELDPSAIVAHIDVYTTSEAHDEFMETNASNIPDVDNTYDLGSNGRRYADIFAVNFHGLATEASVAHTIKKFGALDGDILVWRDADNNWMREPILNEFLRKDGLQILPQYGERVHHPSSPTFNVEDANVHVYTFTDPTATITLQAPTDGNLYSFTIILHNGENTDITWPVDINWIGGNVPSLAQNDILTFFTINGVDWIGTYVGNY